MNQVISRNLIRRPMGLLLAAALAMGLAACAVPAPPLRGKPTPAMTPSPTPLPVSTAAPTEAPTVAPTLEPTLEPSTMPQNASITETLVGMWSLDQFMVFNIRADGTLTSSKTYGNAESETGTWARLPNGLVQLNLPSIGQWTGKVRGNLLVIGDGRESTITTLMRKLDANGNMLPANITASDVSLPLFDLAQVTSMSIQDNWVGLSPIAPVEVSITFTNSANVYTGDIHLGVGGYRNAPISQTLPVTVPQTAMHDALAQLAQTPVELGPYKPFINHTDDYPSIVFALTLADGKTVTIETNSQGQDHVPWRVELDGVEYVSYSDAPSKAFQLLDPYLARDELRALIEKAQQK